MLNLLLLPRVYRKNRDDMGVPRARGASGMGKRNALNLIVRHHALRLRPSLGLHFLVSRTSWQLQLGSLGSIFCFTRLTAAWWSTCRLPFLLSTGYIWPVWGHESRANYTRLYRAKIQLLQSRRNWVGVLSVTNTVNVPQVAKAIVSLRQILLQEPNHFLCRAPGLLVAGGTNGELTKEHHHIKKLTQIRKHGQLIVSLNLQKRLTAWGSRGPCSAHRQIVLQPAAPPRGQAGVPHCGHQCA